MRDDEVRVNLHTHSSLSDGALSPEKLAEHLAAQGVSAAALTDHDTVAGLRPFRQVLSHRGVGCIDGVEISTPCEWGEIHLLAYGFDPGHRELAGLLEAARRGRDPGVRGLVDSLKRLGARGGPPRREAPGPREAIRAVHGAGGAVFLAHPLSYDFDRETLEGLVGELAAAGLDGLEAIYPPYPAEDRRMLESLAGRYSLAVSAGSDYHGPGIPDQPAAVAMSEKDWRAFRDRLFQWPGARPRSGAGTGPAGAPADLRRLRSGRFAARIVFPTVAAAALFILSIFGLIIPGFERALLERKKEMIRELTNSAASILAEYAADERAGRLDRGQAQAAAAARIRDLRYGREGKDYFWITDLRPVMIVHPYRPELNGTDVGGYADRNGVRVFVELVNAIRRREEGYVEYLWQWKDDSHRIVPKLSFVKHFAPWDWVIGTGIYLDDVQAEILSLAGRLVRLSAAIAVLLSLLLLLVVRESLAIERRRRRAESALRDSHERYRALVEASSEGMALVVEGTCTYANPTLQAMLGCSESELALRRLGELVRAPEGEEAGVRSFLDSVAGAPQAPAAASCECILVGRDGRTVDALLTASPLRVAGQAGAILTVKDMGARRRAQAGAGDAGGYRALWAAAPAAVFRATWGRRAFLLDANPAARAIFGLAEDADLSRVNLFCLPADPREAERLYGELAAGGAVRGRELRLARPGGGERVIVLSAVLERDESGAARHLAGMAEDVTERREAGRRQEERAAELESVTMLLGLPVGRLAREAAACGLETPVHAAAARMTRGRRDALLVTLPSGEAVGIVTDGDLRERVLAARLDPGRPVREVMTSPLVAIPEGAPVYEALLRMREKDVGHLAVRGSSGSIGALLHGADLLQLQRRSPAVLLKEIRAAGSIEELADSRGRLPGLASEMLAGGTRPRQVNRTLSAASDRVVERLVGFAARELGEPPSAFAFLALGSEGREEMTPGSDQDNALLYAPPPPGREEPARRYYLALGERVCGVLNGMGVPLCRGGVMARNPSWCVPLDAWAGYFTRWIREPEPERLLDFNIFFDLRCLAGERSLAGRLRAHIVELLADNPPFFLHCARDALGRRLPALRRAGGERLDLKEAMSPVVGFARLYALRHGVPATNTLDRLEGLRERGVLAPASYEEIAAAYAFLMELRLRGGLEGSGRVVDTGSLPPEEEARLQQALTVLPLLHRRISFDFLGSAL
jgi:PAS domain S-box-containing protein